jgi:hypothetical protein
MASLKWSYTEIILPSDSEHPEGFAFQRAIVPVKLELDGRETFEFFSLIDTGADCCYFPSDFLCCLGLDPRNMDRRNVDAIVAEETQIPFAWVNLTVLGFPSMRVFAGFADRLNKEQAGILGFYGALNQFKIFLDPQNDMFVLDDGQ